MALIQAIEKVGYDVPQGTIELAIGGMTCASCVGRVEKALKAVPVCVSTRFDGCASTVIDGRLRHRPSPMLRAVGQR